MVPLLKPGGQAYPGHATRGRITELSRARLCGTIRTDKGRNVFFHARDLEGASYRDMKLKGAVSFELIDDPISGPRAAKVRATVAARRTAVDELGSP